MCIREPSNTHIFQGIGDFMVDHCDCPTVTRKNALRAVRTTSVIDIRRLTRIQLEQGFCLASFACQAGATCQAFVPVNFGMQHCCYYCPLDDEMVMQILRLGPELNTVFSRNLGHHSAQVGSEVGAEQPRLICRRHFCSFGGGQRLIAPGEILRF